MIYDPAKFQPGDLVRVADSAALEAFIRTWTLHHPLQSFQLRHAGQTATVSQSFMYHGGDILYELEGISGIWHEQLLSAA